MDKSEKLGIRLRATQENKSVNGKKYTMYRLAKDTGLDYGHVYRIMHGKISPSRETLTKICNALGCTPQEQTDIFHAAGYLSPKELEEEEYAA